MTDTSTQQPAMADRRLVTENLLRPDEEVEYRLRSDTERYRKGFATIHLHDAEGRPVEKAEVEYRQVSHAFYGDYEATVRHAGGETRVAFTHDRSNRTGITINL